jgi:hypothetical protein
MEEAVEICKLRLFLKLVAQLETYEQIEPLPDIDFNVRPGNTLVGFSSLDAVREAITISRDSKGSAQVRMLTEQDQATLRRIEEEAQIADDAFVMFQIMQTEHGMEAGDFTQAKVDLRYRLDHLREELDRYLAGEYGIDPEDAVAYKKWRATHQPFHWLVEFYGIMHKGGFDVIIGNPPYVEYSQVRGTYTVHLYRTIDCGNLYAYFVERNFSLLRKTGFQSMIVQLPMICTDRMVTLQKECLMQGQAIWFSSFDDRPARLFDGLEHIRATIFIAKKDISTGRVFSTTYNRWYSESRTTLFETLSYLDISNRIKEGAIPKIGTDRGKIVWTKLAKLRPLSHNLVRSSSSRVYFHNSPQYWIRALDYPPFFWNERDGTKLSTQVKALHAASDLDASAIVASLNSSLFYWWFIIHSDCRHLNNREIESFPIGLVTMQPALKKDLAKLVSKLMTDYKANSRRKEAYYKTTGKVVYDEFFPSLSKTIIDEIDQMLAEHYGFTEEELDFIINYDIKYRMGRDGGEEEAD